MKTETLILGGGLSGLHTAEALHQRGDDFHLVEARDRLGGRIVSKSSAGSESAYDLGPTWFWPGQHRMAGLVRALELEASVFDQPSQGDAVFENEQGVVHRGISGVSMAGSYRLEGGLRRLIRGLADRIPKERVRRGARATRIARSGDCVHTTVKCSGQDGNTSEEIIESARVVVALPPRLVASSIDFEPGLSSTQRDALQQVATWMAGSAKVIALYDEPFWRTDGLSGDAVSYRGPLGEIHDASPQSAGPAALFGFVGVPPGARGGSEDALREAAVAQLGRLFGDRAAQPHTVWIKDWAFDPLTATQDDQVAQLSHPITGPCTTDLPTWGGLLLWSGSETASGGDRNNGYLEGALEASERTLRQLAPVEVR